MSNLEIRVIQYKKRIENPGSESSKPVDGTNCTVCITPLQNVEDIREVITFPLQVPGTVTLGEGTTFLDRAFEECLLTMNKEETCCLTVTLKLPEEDLEREYSFNIALLDYEDGVPPIWEVPNAELIRRAAKFKATGIELYNRGRIVWSFYKFSKAIKYLIICRSDPTDQEKASIQELKLSLYLNLAACQLKTGKYEHVITNCSKALNLDGKNVKALFRRGKAYIHLEEYEKAKDDLSKARALDRGNSAVLQQMDILNSKLKALAKVDCEKYKNLFRH